MDMEDFMDALYLAVHHPDPSLYPFGVKLTDELLELKLLVDTLPEERQDKLRKACDRLRATTEAYTFTHGMGFMAKLLFASLAS